MFTMAVFEDEKESTRYHRSIYVAKDLKAGEILTVANIRRIRPGLGLAPKYWELVLGRPVRKAVKKGTPLSWDLV